jgi:nuclear transport factor 2 (NTF2) superfamily protein
MAEDAWNARDPQRVALAYTIDSRWGTVLNSYRVAAEDQGRLVQNN